MDKAQGNPFKISDAEAEALKEGIRLAKEAIGKQKELEAELSEIGGKLQDENKKKLNEYFERKLGGKPRWVSCQIRKNYGYGGSKELGEEEMDVKVDGNFENIPSVSFTLYGSRASGKFDLGYLNHSTGSLKGSVDEVIAFSKVIGKMADAVNDDELKNIAISYENEIEAVRASFDAKGYVGVRKLEDSIEEFEKRLRVCTVDLTVGTKGKFLQEGKKSCKAWFEAEVTKVTPQGTVYFKTEERTGWNFKPEWKVKIETMQDLDYILPRPEKPRKAA